MNSKLIYTIVVAVGGALEEGVRNLLRSKGQKNFSFVLINQLPNHQKRI